MTVQLPPICRDCRRLLAHTEEVVRRFSCYHKYTIGTNLRQQAMALMRSLHLVVCGWSKITRYPTARQLLIFEGENQ